MTHLMEVYDAYDGEVIAAGMHDDTLQIDLPAGTRPDWRIVRRTDEMPHEPEDMGLPATFLVRHDHDWRVTAGFNTALNGWAQYTSLDVSDIESLIERLNMRHSRWNDRGQHYMAGPQWYEVIPRFLRIFHGIDAKVETDYQVYALILDTPEWRSTTGFQGDFHAEQETAQEPLAWANGECYYLEYQEWDADLKEYVTEDSLGGFYGDTEVGHALDSFGKSMAQSVAA